MSTGTLTCAVCGVGMTTADAEMAVATDAGPVHQECFEGPVPPGSTGAEAINEAEEEAARRDYNDVPLPPDAAFPEGFITKTSDFPPVDHDRADRDMQLMERDERWHGGRYDEDGMGY